MTDPNDPQNYDARDPHDVKVKFVNEVAVCGFLNGNVNITFNTAQFSQIKDLSGKMVVYPDRVVASRLRMDLFTAQQLRDSLNRIIEANTKPTSEKVN